MTEKLFPLNSIPVPTVYAEHRTIRDCNHAFAHLFGYMRPQLVSASFHLLYPDFDDYVRIGKLWRKNLGGQTIYQDERVMRKADGSNFWARVNGLAEFEDNPFARATYCFEQINRPVAPNRAKLTERQTQILTLVSMGKTNHSIGNELGLSPRTIEAHRARIMQAVGVKNAAELMAWFQAEF